MDSKAADHSEEETATHKAKVRPDQHASADPSADAKRAKKKQKRAKHRARLRRPHTGG